MRLFPKTSRREHSAETLAIIISLHDKIESLVQIRPPFIINRHNRQPDQPILSEIFILSPEKPYGNS